MAIFTFFGLIIFTIWFCFYGTKLCFWIFKQIFIPIYEMIFLLFEEIFVFRKQRKNGFLQKKELSEKIQQEEIKERNNNKVLQEENKILNACLNKVRELRLKYSRADEDLFQKYIKRFPFDSVGDLGLIEQEIIDSHCSKERKNIEKYYSVEELKDLIPIEEYKHVSFVFKVFKIGEDYILYFRDMDSNNIQLFQSQEYKIVFEKMVEWENFENKVNISTKRRW